MKVSMCTTWFKGKRIQEVVEIAKQYDFDGIELWPGHISSFLEEENTLQDLRLLMEESGLEVCCISPYLNFTKSLEEAEASRDKVSKCIDYANDLKVNLIRVFVGDIPSKEMEGAQWRRSIGYLKEICSYDPSIDFGLETHYKQPTDRIESIEYLLEEVAMPNLKVIFDGFNLAVDGVDQLEALNRFDEKVIHVHMKNYEWATRTPQPIHVGDADNQVILEELRRRHYEGFISLEYFCDDYHTVMKDSIDQIRKGSVV